MAMNDADDAGSPDRDDPAGRHDVKPVHTLTGTVRPDPSDPDDDADEFLAWFRALRRDDTD